MPGINDRDIQTQTGISPGSYTNISGTINAQGIFTAISNGIIARSGRFVIPGSVLTGIDTGSVLQIEPILAGLSLTRLQARVETASTSGPITFTVQISSGTGAFAATTTSQVFTIAQGANQIDITSITTAIPAVLNNNIAVNITAAGTGAADLKIVASFG